MNRGMKCVAVSVLLAAMSSLAAAEVTVSDLTAGNWQGKLNEAMGKYRVARNQKDRGVYLDAVDTVVYIATNCPGMDEAQKKVKLANCAFDIANGMMNDGYVTDDRVAFYERLLQVVADHCDWQDRRFEARYLLAKRKCLVCPEAEYPAAEAALRKLFEDPAQHPGARLAKLKMIVHERLPFAIDVLAVAEKIKAQSDDPEVHLKYYLEMNEYMSFMYGGWEHGQEQPGVDPLNPAYSYEARLAFIEKGLADPKVENKSPLFYQKAWLLGKLERFDEAAQVYLSQTSDPVPAKRADALVNYARFMEGRAERYYTEPWMPYLKQATAAYMQAVTEGVGPKTPSNWGYREQAADCAIKAGEYASAFRALDAIIANAKGATNDFVRVRLGRIAWAEERYEDVVRFYPPVDSPLNIREVYTLNDRANVVKSLKLLGREEEELAALAIMKEKAGGNWKSYYSFAYERLKAKLGQKDGE